MSPQAMSPVCTSIASNSTDLAGKVKTRLIAKRPSVIICFSSLVEARTRFVQCQVVP